MNEEKQYDLIVIVTKHGFSDDVIKAAKSGGATGGTILHARGAGYQEAETFFGISLEREKDLVLIVAARETRQAIMQAVCKETGLHTPAHSLSFSLPVNDVVGLSPLSSDM